MHNQKLKRIFEMNLGLVFCALAIALFFKPTGFVSGGTSGLTMIITMLIDDKYYDIIYYAVNIILLFISLIFLGKKYFLKTIYAALMLPTFVTGLSLILKYTNLEKEFTNLGIGWLSVGLGSVLLGYGIGLNIRNGGSTGGVDILQSILYKYFRVSYSASNILVNALIIIGGYFLHYDLTNVLSAIIFLYVSGYVIDSITFGGFNRRAVYIKTSKTEEVKEAILKDLGRGCTSIDIKGGYTNEDGELLLCVCLAREYLELRDMVENIDEKAFTFVTRATEVRGDGFSEYTEDKLNQIKNRKNRTR